MTWLRIGCTGTGSAVGRSGGCSQSTLGCAAQAGCRPHTLVSSLFERKVELGRFGGAKLCGRRFDVKTSDRSRWAFWGGNGRLCSRGGLGEVARGGSHFYTLASPHQGPVWVCCFAMRPCGGVLVPRLRCCRTD